jgi:predicted acylesterase/phospholipase RssA
LLSTKDKLNLFKNTYKNYGRTALCLSGGASFGYYHLGVVKALFDAKLLPSVFTGTSAGGLIAALVCVRTDEELEQVLNPKLYTRLTACSDSISTWILRWWKTGAIFDARDWAQKLQWITKGSLTFLEAYERTGRILNISVIAYDPHSPSKVLNYITAPDCVIWSAGKKYY